MRRLRRPLATVPLALLAACAAEPTVQLSSELVNHTGPAVVIDRHGPMSRIPVLYSAFDPDRAMETTRFAEGFYRAPGSDGFNATLDHLRERLEEAGFGSHPQLELYELESEMTEPAWTPRSASLELLRPNGTSTVLHAFSDVSEVDRVMLPHNAPSASITANVVFRLADVRGGTVLATRTKIRPDLMKRAEQRGAVAILSSSLEPFNFDPSGGNAHLDSIQFRALEVPVPLPVCQISPRSMAIIQDEHERSGGARIAFRALVKLDERPLRTLVAVVDGASRGDEAVVLATHIQYPGASDNASGLATQLECAVSLAGLLESGELDWPVRSIVFLWGPELIASETWLAETSRTAIASLTVILTGDSPERGGSPLLLERCPDPGALTVLPPDEHTEWGAGDVDAELLSPNGLAVVTRCAMVDVARHTGDDWPTVDHPWEGGADHDVFFQADVPGVLLWHFSSLTYQTTRDRMDFISAEEMRRTGVVGLASALCVAAPQPGDRERFVHSLEIEESVRVSAAREADNPELAASWTDWCLGAREWLERVCSR